MSAVNCIAGRTSLPVASKGFIFSNAAAPLLPARVPAAKTSSATQTNPTKIVDFLFIVFLFLNISDFGKPTFYRAERCGCGRTIPLRRPSNQPANDASRQDNLEVVAVLQYATRNARKNPTARRTKFLVQRSSLCAQKFPRYSAISPLNVEPIMMPRLPVALQV